MTRGGTRRGFTLIEIMVALVMSAIVISALYQMFVTFSEVFRIQEQTSATQLNVRYALEQVTEDLRRAGLLVTPNSRIDDRVCPKPTSEIYGIIHRDGEGIDKVPFRDTVNQNIAP